MSVRGGSVNPNLPPIATDTNANGDNVQVVSTLGAVQKAFRDLPSWRTLAPAPAATVAGSATAHDPVGGVDSGGRRYGHPFIYELLSATVLNAYCAPSDDWLALGSPALAGTFGAGADAVFFAGLGPSGTLAAGATTTSVVLTTALPAAVGVNQLANRGDGVGFVIRITGNASGSSSGKTEERRIIANTSGTTPTITLDSALSFTPATGDAYEIKSGRVYLLSAGVLAAGIWKYYDVATNSYSANLATTNLPATIASDSALLALSAWHVPSSRTPGDGFLGQVTATAVAAGTITGSVTGADAAVAANEYRNFSIRIVSDTTNKTAAGQRRRIASHTVGPSPVYTLSSNWTVTPSTAAVFVIENNNTDILLFSSTVATTFTYSVTGDAWSTATFAARGSAVGAGVTTAQLYGVDLDAAKNARYSHIFSLRGGGSAALDLLDIAGAAAGSWSNAVTYGNSGQTFSGGTSFAYGATANGGKYLYLNPNGGQRVARLDLLNRVLEPYGYEPNAQGTALTSGNKMAAVPYVDGLIKASLVCLRRESGTEFYQLNAWR